MTEFKARVLLVGDVYVGKSQLFTYCLGSSFSNDYHSTVGVDLVTFTQALLREFDVTLHIFDTSGQERFRMITSAYYSGAKAAVFLYDVSNYSTFTRLDYWEEFVADHTNRSRKHLFLVGCKVDLERQVSYCEGKLRADKMGAIFLETSAKTGLNVKQFFNTLAFVLSKTRKE